MCWGHDAAGNEVKLRRLRKRATHEKTGPGIDLELQQAVEEHAVDFPPSLTAYYKAKLIWARMTLAQLRWERALPVLRRSRTEWQRKWDTKRIGRGMAAMMRCERPSAENPKNSVRLRLERLKN